MSYFDQFYRRDLGLEKMPEGDFVLPVTHGESQGGWIWRVVDLHGHTASSGYVNTEEEGRLLIDQFHNRQARSFREKVVWRLAGDRLRGTRAPLSDQQADVVYGNSDEVTTREMDIVRYIMNGGEYPDVPRAGGPRSVLRCNGNHYVAVWEGVRRVRDQDRLGFGGRVFRWFFLDDPEKTIHESNNLYWQCEIPPQWRDALPDNIEWAYEPLERKDYP